MDLRLPEEVAALQATTRELAMSLLEHEPAFQATGVVPPAVHEALRSLGYFGLGFPEEYGGTPVSFLAKCVVEAELSRLPPQFWAELRALYGPASKTLLHHGTPEQKQRWVPGMIRGEIPVAFALTEPHGGSDVGAMRTTAARCGQGWMLNGSKIFISNADKAKLISVFAYTNRSAGPKGGISCFLLPTDTPGFSLGKVTPLMGTATPGVHEIIMQDCELPAEALLGEEGRGLAYAMEGLNEGRVSIGAKAVGMGELALEEAIAFARQRIAFGQPIAEFQAIRHMLADMATEIHAARLVMLEAAWSRDQAALTPARASMAKLFCSEAGGRVVDKALQIFGGTGYCRGTIVERLYRDIRVLRIYEGSSEVQRNQIAKQLLR